MWATEPGSWSSRSSVRSSMRVLVPRSGVVMAPGYVVLLVREGSGGVRQERLQVPQAALGLGREGAVGGGDGAQPGRWSVPLRQRSGRRLLELLQHPLEVAGGDPAGGGEAGEQQQQGSCRGEQRDGQADGHAVLL